MRLLSHSAMMFVTFSWFSLGCESVDTVDAENDIESSEHAVVGGTPTRDPLSVVGLAKDDGSYCSAVVISNRHILTAAHCINYQPLRRSFGRAWIGGMTNQRILRGFSLGTQLGAKDLAVAQMEAIIPSSTPPAIIATSMPNSGPYTLVGFGCTTTGGNDFGFKHYRTISSLPSSVACDGDSGGGLFRGTLADNGELIGVPSYERSGRDYYAAPVTYRQDIQGLVNATEFGNVCYRVHVAEQGWLPAVCDGNPAGVAGQGRRIEAIQIWSNIPGVQLCYRGHVEAVGWQLEVCDGELAGTVGQSRRLEAIWVRIAAGKSSQVTGLTYQAYVQNTGWQASVREREIAGTTGQSLRLESLKLGMPRPCIMVGDRPLRCDDTAARLRCQSCGTSGVPRYACSFAPDPRSSCAEPSQCSGSACRRYGSPGNFRCITDIECR